ncbi:MAG: basic amino acid ABC transporter substrate-binding protein [Actinomycetota bacterium]|nr:basic amino acid ABC transporter substrate-binding protein [Actinomycetota bacterium]
MKLSDSLWFRLLTVALVAVFGLVACGGEPTDEPPAGDATGGAEEPTFTTLEEGFLTVGSDIPYPPFEYREGGELVGLDIDLITEIAERLGLSVEDHIIDTGFDTIFTQLAGGRFDVVVAASTITPEREKQVNFSDPYYNAQQSLTVNVNETPDIQSVDDLGAGDVIAVQGGTTGKQWAEDNLPDDVEIRSFPEGPDGYTALEAGDVTGVINDEPTALAEIAEREGLELVETIDTGEAYGIAVDPENEELLEAINQTLAEIIEDGTYEEIYSRYKDLPPGGSVVAES